MAVIASTGGAIGVGGMQDMANHDQQNWIVKMHIVYCKDEERERVSKLETGHARKSDILGKY